MPFSKQVQETDPTLGLMNIKRAMQGLPPMDKAPPNSNLQGPGPAVGVFPGTPDGDHMSGAVDNMQAANQAQAGANPDLAAKLEAMKVLRQRYIDKQNAGLQQAMPAARRAPAAAIGQNYPAEE